MGKKRVDKNTAGYNQPLLKAAQNKTRQELGKWVSWRAKAPESLLRTQERSDRTARLPDDERPRHQCRQQTARFPRLRAGVGSRLDVASPALTCALGEQWTRADGEASVLSPRRGLNQTRRPGPRVRLACVYAGCTGTRFCCSSGYCSNMNVRKTPGSNLAQKSAPRCK